MWEHGAVRLTGRQILRVIVATVAFVVAGPVAVSEASPTVSPGVKRTFVGVDPGTHCRFGYLCAFVPGDGGYYRFDFTHCNTLYRVSGWHGRGFIVNSQFGGVTALFFTRWGRVYASRRARGVSGIIWQPVWSLRVC